MLDGTSNEETFMESNSFSALCYGEKFTEKVVGANVRIFWRIKWMQFLPVIGSIVCQDVGKTLQGRLSLMVSKEYKKQEDLCTAYGVARLACPATR